MSKADRDDLRALCERARVRDEDGARARHELGRTSTLVISLLDELEAMQRSWHSIVHVSGPTSGEVHGAALRLAEVAEDLVEKVQEAGGRVASLDVSVRSFEKVPRQ